MQRVGILGGTFDPIHYGHLAIAEECRWHLGLTCVYIVPAAHQPLKPEGHVASPQQRMMMVRLACADNPSLVPTDIELHRPSPSYTLTTVQTIQQIVGTAIEFWLVLGSDAAMTLPHWFAPHELLELVRLAVVVRPGTSFNLTALEAQLPGISARVEVIAGPQLDISSTMLRRRLASGQPVRYQLPEPVRGYIEREKLYGTG